MSGPSASIALVNPLEELSALAPLATWREAELFAADHMRALGFSDATATPLGADGGIDVDATGAVAQVKHFSQSPVGAPAVQRIRGAAGRHQKVLFYAFTGYTRAAIRFAEDQDVALFTYSLDRVASPASSAAEQLSTRGYIVAKQARSTTARENFLKHLTEYCQAVVDARVLVMDYANPLINHAVELLAVDEAAARSEAERLRFDELQPLLLEIRDLEASFAEGRTRPIGDLVTDVNRYEALVQALCGRFGIDVDQFIREAADLRIAGMFENEQARTERAGAMKLQFEADAAHDAQRG